MTQYLLNRRDFSKPTSTSKHKTSTSKCIGIFTSLYEAQQQQENIIFDFLAKKYGEDAYEQKLVKIAETQRDQNEEYQNDKASPRRTWILPIHTIVSDHSPCSSQWTSFPLNNHFVVRKSTTPLRITVKYKRATGAWIGCGWVVEDVIELEIVELDLTKIPPIEDRSSVAWEEYPKYCDILKDMKPSETLDFLRVVECDNTISTLRGHFTPPPEPEVETETPEEETESKE